MTRADELYERRLNRLEREKFASLKTKSSLEIEIRISKLIKKAQEFYHEGWYLLSHEWNFEDAAVCFGEALGYYKKIDLLEKGRQKNTRAYTLISLGEVLFEINKEEAEKSLQEGLQILEGDSESRLHSLKINRAQKVLRYIRGEESGDLWEEHREIYVNSNGKNPSPLNPEKKESCQEQSIGGGLIRDLQQKRKQESLW